LKFGGFFVHSSMLKRIVNLIFEWQMLKRKKREWRRLAWVEFPESVAEHSLSTAQIWYILAQLEWADANKVVTMLVRHDFSETRIWDIDKIGAAYLDNKKQAEAKINKEQFWELEIFSQLVEYLHEYKKRDTLEWKIAKDADLLECAFQAKQYLENWHTSVQDRIDNVWQALQTESAKQIREEMTKSSFTDWRQWLKKLD